MGKFGSVGARGSFELLHSVYSIHRNKAWGYSYTLPSCHAHISLGSPDPCFSRSVQEFNPDVLHVGNTDPNCTATQVPRSIEGHRL